ncbi:hypothetical protein LIER_30562 [Lithospermum erythrorhizon]|uniref:Uncharacterized protein n=1 Tax=Lithospermum erythrorhizon TaxID=34254 RepID=A0AAV3RTW6_LITER
MPQRHQPLPQSMNPPNPQSVLPISNILQQLTQTYSIHRGGFWYHGPIRKRVFYYQHALELDGKLAKERAKVVRRGREDLLLAYRQEIPLRSNRVGASVLADFVLHNRNRVHQLPALAEEYKRRFPTDWFDDTRPFPSITLASLPPRP